MPALAEALRSKVFKDDRTFIAFLKSQNGHVDLTAFSFENPFEEEVKEHFNITSIDISNLSESLSKRFADFARRSGLSRGLKTIVCAHREELEGVEVRV